MGVVWCCVLWCVCVCVCVCVVWCGVVWCGVVWCDVMVMHLNELMSVSDERWCR